MYERAGLNEQAVLAKHATASVFVLREEAAGWRLGLIEHPRYRRLMMPGGHVEPTESSAEAAVREVAEETGLAVRLLTPPAPPVPAGYRAARVAQPWWIAEYHVPPDGQLATAHVHVDHLYLAVPGEPDPVGAPAHPFAWYGAADLPGLEMFPDARVLARAVLAAVAGEPGAELAPALAGVPGLAGNVC